MCFCMYVCVRERERERVRERVRVRERERERERESVRVFCLFLVAFIGTFIHSRRLSRCFTFAGHVCFLFWVARLYYYVDTCDSPFYGIHLVFPIPGGPIRTNTSGAVLEAQSCRLDEQQPPPRVVAHPERLRQRHSFFSKRRLCRSRFFPRGSFVVLLCGTLLF